MKRKHYIWILVLFSVLGLTGKSNGLDYALYLQENSNHYDAITEFKRFIFLNEGHPKVGQAHYYLAQSYKSEKNWEKAIDAIKKSNFYVNDSIRSQRRLEMAVIHIVNKNYDLAAFELTRLYYFSTFPELKHNICFYLGLTYLYKQDWQHSEEWFLKYYEDSNNETEAQLECLFEESGQIPYKSEKLAKWMSTLVPGLGQIYGKDYRNGFNAMALNLVTATLLINSVIDLRWEDVFTVNLTLFERYYKGNRKKAVEVIRSYNQLLDQSYANDVFQFILKKDNGF